MHWINIFLWLSIIGATQRPAESLSIQTIRTDAIIGLVVAILWQHGSVRGFWRMKPKASKTLGNPEAPAASDRNLT
jgi:hypothetical protein